MHYSASTIVLKRLVREISNNQNANHCVLWNESSFAKLKLLKERHFTLPTRKITFQSTLITQTVVGEGREEVTGESKLPTSRTVYMNFAFPAPSLFFLAFSL